MLSSKEGEPGKQRRGRGEKNMIENQNSEQEYKRRHLARCSLPGFIPGDLVFEVGLNRAAAGLDCPGCGRADRHTRRRPVRSFLPDWESSNYSICFFVVDDTISTKQWLSPQASHRAGASLHGAALLGKMHARIAGGRGIVGANYSPLKG